MPAPFKTSIFPDFSGLMADEGKVPCSAELNITALALGKLPHWRLVHDLGGPEGSWSLSCQSRSECVQLQDHTKQTTLQCHICPVSEKQCLSIKILLCVINLISCHKNSGNLDYFTSIRIIILLGQDLFSKCQEHGCTVAYVDGLFSLVNKVLHLYFEKRMG